MVDLPGFDRRIFHQAGLRRKGVEFRGAVLAQALLRGPECNHWAKIAFATFFLTGVPR